MDDVVTAGAVISRLRDLADNLELGDLAVVAEVMYKNNNGNLHSCWQTAPIIRG